MTDSAYLTQVLHQLEQTRQQLRAAEDELAVWRQRAATRPVETHQLTQPELTVRIMTPPPPTCPDCQHPRHRGYDCQMLADFIEATERAFLWGVDQGSVQDLDGAVFAPPPRP
jgi:hypothetical protein